MRYTQSSGHTLVWFGKCMKPGEIASNSPPQNATAVEDNHPHSALGAMVWLMKHAEYHQNWDLRAINIDIVPPIVLGQYRIYCSAQSEPVGFVTWGYVSEEVKSALVANRRPMTWSDWNSGDLLLFNDFVAPFGHGREIVGDLRSNMFAGQSAFSLRRNAFGGVRKVNRWKGKPKRPDL